MDASAEDRSRSGRFIAALIEDVLAARARLSSNPTQTARRDVVRVSMAAIEGMTWIAREHVRGSLEGVEQLLPMTDLALREVTYGVTEHGEVQEQVRPLPVLTAIRLFITQAQVMCPELSVDLSGGGWSHLRQAVKIRNRITHPKPEQELSVSDADLDVVLSAVSWMTATVEYVMASTNLALATYTDQARDLVERLKAGDPEALAAYREVLKAVEGED